MLPDRRERRERRPKHERRGWMFDSKTQCHCGAERFTEIDDTYGIDIRPTENVRARSLRITHKPFFRRRSRIAAVPAVIGQQHIQPDRAKRTSQGHSITAMTGVPTEDDDGRPRRGARPRDEPR